MSEFTCKFEIEIKVQQHFGQCIIYIGLISTTFEPNKDVKSTLLTYLTKKRSISQAILGEHSMYIVSKNNNPKKLLKVR